MIPARRRLASAIGVLQRRLNMQSPISRYELERTVDILREIDVMLAQMEDEPIPARLRLPVQPKLRLVNPEDHLA